MQQPASRSQFGWRADRAILGMISLLPGFLFVAGVVLTALDTTAGPLLLITHFITQFIVLLVFGSLLIADAGLDGGGRAMWAFAFLFAAPVAIPIYYVFRELVPPRAPRHVRVVDVSGEHGSLAA
jgi:hypothetical protein